MRLAIGLWTLAVILTIMDAAAEESAPSTSTNSVGPTVINVWPHHLALGKTITVVVTNLLEWSRQSPENDVTKLVPFINGQRLNGLFPAETYLRSSILRFRLAITEENKGAWTDLLGRPTNLSRLVSFTVGMEGKERFDSVYRYDNKVLRLTIMSGPWMLVSLAVVALTGLILVRLSRKTDLIRDVTPLPPPPGRQRPYNLGRTQMAFWFFLILTSYVVLWLITDSLETITPSILALMGISAATALGDVLIDTNKHESDTARRDPLLAERKSLQAGLAEPDSQMKSVGATSPDAAVAPSADALALSDRLKGERLEKQKRLEEVDALLKGMDPTHKELASQGFLHDLLSDGHDYSFHRFQIVVWTLVLGIIFVASVYDGLRMPEFNSTLLGLMGISAGAYVSLKFPEK